MFVSDLTASFTLRATASLKIARFSAQRGIHIRRIPSKEKHSRSIGIKRLGNMNILFADVVKYHIYNLLIYSYMFVVIYSNRKCSISVELTVDVHCKEFNCDLSGARYLMDYGAKNSENCLPNCGRLWGYGIC